MTHSLNPVTRDQRALLSQAVIDKAKELWDDPDALHEFAQAHRVRLEIDHSDGVDAAKAGVMRMVATALVDGKYEWEVLGTFGSGPVFLLKRELPVEVRHPVDLHRWGG